MGPTFSTAAIAFLLAGGADGTAVDGPPPAPKKPVVDTYHGVAVTDDYRWLEDYSQPDVRGWSDAQNAYARSLLDALPDVAAIRARVSELLSAPVVTWRDPVFRGGKLFVSRYRPPRQQPEIVVMESADAPDAARVVVDPLALDQNGGVAYDWFVPSPDGKLVAVSLSQGGSECGDVHFFDVATGKQVDLVLARVNGGTAGGDVEWSADSKGLYYTRYPRIGERPESELGGFVQVWYHELGTPFEKDRYELGRDFPSVAEIILDASAGGHLLASVQKGDSGEFMHFLRAPGGGWTQVTRFEDRVVQAAFGPAGELLLLSRAGSPRGKLLRVPLDHAVLADAKVLVPESEETLESSFLDEPAALVASAHCIDATVQLGGPSEIRIFDREGKRQPGPRFLPLGAATMGTPLAGDDLLVGLASYVEPFAWWRFDAKTGATTMTALASKPPYDFADCEVVRELATSKDGTKVPLTIVKRKDVAADGSRPCLLTAYGGFGRSMEPRFLAGRRFLLEQGIVFAEAVLRGGGEFGSTWHADGRLEKKQNCFDDFAACARLLVEKKYAAPGRIAIEGGSNGGLLMGAALTQHPELFACVVSHVGIYDMLRNELTPNGAFNTGEYGSVKDANQFRALYAYSPYHHVADGTKYPPVLFLTGANDPRVDPMQSRKMTARLQAAGATVLLRTSSSSGHGMGTALGERIEQTVDVDAFLFKELGVRVKQTGKSRP
jgi:prolyl oligopeptidase